MKKIFAAVLFSAALLLSGCNSGKAEIVIIPDKESSENTAAPAESHMPENSAENGQTADTVPSENIPVEAAGEEIWRFLPETEYDNYGYSHFKAEKTGSYSFSPINSDGIGWSVYILDEEFRDAERYIPQVYDQALDGSGELQIEAGKYIYIYCSANGWTMQEIPDGACMSVFFKD